MGGKGGLFSRGGKGGGRRDSRDYSSKGGGRGKGGGGKGGGGNNKNNKSNKSNSEDNYNSVGKNNQNRQSNDHHSEGNRGTGRVSLTPNGRNRQQQNQHSRDNRRPSRDRRQNQHQDQRKNQQQRQDDNRGGAQRQNRRGYSHEPLTGRENANLRQMMDSSGITLSWITPVENFTAGANVKWHLNPIMQEKGKDKCLRAALDCIEEVLQGDVLEEQIQEQSDANKKEARADALELLGVMKDLPSAEFNEIEYRRKHFQLFSWKLRSIPIAAFQLACRTKNPTRFYSSIRIKVGGDRPTVPVRSKKDAAAPVEEEGALGGPDDEEDADFESGNGMDELEDAAGNDGEGEGGDSNTGGQDEVVVVANGNTNTDNTAATETADDTAANTNSTTGTANASASSASSSSSSRPSQRSAGSKSRRDTVGGTGLDAKRQKNHNEEAKKAEEKRLKKLAKKNSTSGVAIPK